MTARWVHVGDAAGEIIECAMDTQHTTCRVDFGIPEKVSEVNWIPHQPSSECDEYFQRHAITHVFRNVGPAELGQAGTHFYTVHRLVLHQHVEDLNHLCCGLAELMAGEKVGASVASSVGGFHSPRDFLKWPEVSETLLPEVFKQAMKKVISATDPHGSTEITEAWLNQSPSGAWNVLHTHPGSDWSGVFFCCDGGSIGCDNYAGQLVLLPTAPPQLSEGHQRHLQPLDGYRSNPKDEYVRRADELYFLCVDPVPGTLLVSPSFVPHFVLPVEPAANRAPRVSVAFNCRD